MTEALNRRSFVLPFTLPRIDRFADVGHADKLIEFYRAGFNIHFQIDTPHTGLPKYRQLRVHPAAGTDVAAADKFATRHSDKQAHHFPVGQTMLSPNYFAVFQL